MGYQEIPDVTKQKVIRMYEAGERLSAITAETGLSKPSIYWVLHSAGIKPSRRVRNDQLSAQELLEALKESEREVGRLQAEIERLQDR